jgi:hypothetical protein
MMAHLLSRAQSTQHTSRASGVVSVLSLVEKASSVFLASYFSRQKRLSMKEWMCLLNDDFPSRQ